MGVLTPHSLVSEDDWRTYKGRGAWLLVAWTLGALFACLPILVQPAWPSIMALFPNHLWAFVIGCWSMNAGITLVGNIVFAAVYAANLPLFEQYKINRDQPWPWRNRDAATRQRFWAHVRWSVGRVCFNNFVMVVPSLLLSFYQFRPHGMFSWSVEDFPSLFTFLWQLAACLLIEDTMFYWGHRTLHQKWLYPHIHKVHHEYHHPIALSSEHAHPVEFILGNLLPVIAGPIITKAHMFTIWCWILLRIAVSIDEHCGYAFPWSPVRLLPFGATADGHDYHHTHNDGIFASQFVWWDWLCGTEGRFHEWRVAVQMFGSEKNAKQLKAG